MPDEPNEPPGKTRTRGHVIADLGINFVERQVLLAGYTVERYFRDYGLDLWVRTYDPAGQVEEGHLALQVKATDHFATHADGRTFPVRVDVVDLKAWLMEWVTVILVVYDAAADRAFWLDVQEYARRVDMDPDPANRTVTLAVPTANVLDVSAARAFRERRRQNFTPRRGGM